MSIGHESYLDHDTTKAVARRSDSIVSSTMSFTLLPVDDFKKINFSVLTAAEVTEWVDRRHAYRAASISQAQVPPDQECGEDFSDFEELG